VFDAVRLLDQPIRLGPGARGFVDRALVSREESAHARREPEDPPHLP